jgi:hypothetical protein
MTLSPEGVAVISRHEEEEEDSLFEKVDIEHVKKMMH